MYLEAFIMGFIGSLHCVTMCGPLALAVSNINKGNYQQTRLFYNSGRVITYSFLGLIAGLLGMVFNISAFQGILSITAGLFFILVMVLMLLKKRYSLPFVTKSVNYLKKQFGKYLKGKTVFSNIALGIINGFLPCGLVYMAVTASLVQPNLLMSVGFMLFFGLGTFPAMLFSMNIFMAINKYISFQKLIPVFLSIIGVLLILRGLELDIPYLSPSPSGHHHMMN